MKNLWEQNPSEDLLDQRVYTSQLLGQNEDLVLHGGGNTSVKITEKDIYGEEKEVLYVKGSGYDLKTIPTEGFTPCDLESVSKLATLNSMTDAQMVKELKKSILNPKSPNPSIETILHGIIPYKFVDHTHADAVVTISNGPNGEKILQEIYGPEVLILPFIMPGFILAKQIYQATKDLDWSQLKGIVLLHHGVFTFNDDPKIAYSNMIDLVSQSEDYLIDKNTGWSELINDGDPQPLLIDEKMNGSILEIREYLGNQWGHGAGVQIFSDRLSQTFSISDNLESIASRGPITPDHVINNKRIPVIFSRDPSSWIKDIEKYKEDYQHYFNEFKSEGHQILDSHPKWGVIPGVGILVMSPERKRIPIIRDIARHNMRCIMAAEKFSEWRPLSKQDIFDLEYWELEQAKLKSATARPELFGKVAVVTGAHSGIGRATATSLRDKGAMVFAIDINPEITKLAEKNIIGVKGDITQAAFWDQLSQSIIQTCGGLDILVSNAGIFPSSKKLSEWELEEFNNVMTVNLTGHWLGIKTLTPLLSRGKNSSIIIVGSKNVKAPGPGAGPYSISKAAITQMGRVLALELSEKKVRVQTIHPDAVFDTGLWSEDLIKQRADSYGISEEQYKTKNLLGVEISSIDVANIVSLLVGDNFLKTTGAQISIDGGNDRTL